MDHSVGKVGTVDSGDDVVDRDTDGMSGSGDGGDSAAAAATKEAAVNEGCQSNALSSGTSRRGMPLASMMTLRGGILMDSMQILMVFRRMSKVTVSQFSSMEFRTSN